MLFFRSQRPAVYPPAEGRHVIVTGVPRGDRIPYLYHPTLPACGQVLSAPPQPLNDRYKVFAETKPPPPPLPQPRPERPPSSPHHRVCCTIRGPDPDKGDPGQIIDPAILSPAACFASMTM